MSKLPPTQDRYDTVLALLRDILQRINAIERAVDQLDRNQRPYGDGYVRRRA